MFTINPCLKRDVLKNILNTIIFSRCREDELCTTYKEQVEELKAVHLEELHKTLSEWRKKVSQLDDEVSSLRIM